MKDTVIVVSSRVILITVNCRFRFEEVVFYFFLVVGTLAQPFIIPSRSYLVFCTLITLTLYLFFFYFPLNYYLGSTLLFPIPTYSKPQFHKILFSFFQICLTLDDTLAHANSEKRIFSWELMRKLK